MVATIDRFPWCGSCVTAASVLENAQGSWKQALAGRIDTSQRRVLGALAVEPAETPYSSDYVHRHHLPATSMVQSSLNALERTEPVEQGQGAPGGWQTRSLRVG